MPAKGGYVYILSNKNRTVLYIGVTNSLKNRVWQHKNGQGSVFTKKYNCDELLYFEFFDAIVSAIAREKQLKKWKRAWKEELIKTMNPDLIDISEQARDHD